MRTRLCCLIRTLHVLLNCLTITWLCFCGNEASKGRRTNADLLAKTEVDWDTPLNLPLNPPQILHAPQKWMTSRLLSHGTDTIQTYWLTSMIRCFYLSTFEMSHGPTVYTREPADRRTMQNMRTSTLDKRPRVTAGSYDIRHGHYSITCPPACLETWPQ